MYNPYSIGMPPQMGAGAQYGQMGYNPMQQPTIQQNAPQTNLDWIRVNNFGDVQNVTVQPGQKAWIMLANEPAFALKSADNMGITTTDFYRFERYNPEQSKPEPDYVTRDEFNAFIEQLTAPKKEVNPE